MTVAECDVPAVPTGRIDTRPPRVLLIAEAANPEFVSVPLEGWSHSRAIARVTRAHLVTQVRNRDAILRAGLDEREFTAIDSEAVARPLWKLSERLRGGSGKGWTLVTAMQSLTYQYTERLIWKQFGARIRAREFDIVHRLTPLSPTIPSPIARRCARAGVPFVIGPLNGGVPWPKDFGAARRREREWLSYVRGAHRFMPGFRSTREHAAAIIVGSRDTLAQMPRRYLGKCVYIPENAVDPARFAVAGAPAPAPPLRVAFVGRLVPYKGADMLLEAAAPLIRDGAVVVDLIGDGPERERLVALAARERIEGGVSFAGWVDHTLLRARLAGSHVFGFPSVREFGGAVVLEAMALGLVPVVVEYGGPGELVSPATGFAVPMGGRETIVRSFREILARLAAGPSVLAPMSLAARRRARTSFTWDAKAAQVLEVYRWALGERGKPDFGMPLPDPAPGGEDTP